MKPSGKSSLLSEYLATPSAKYLGITATDILNYDLPTDKLTDKDVAALKSELSDRVLIIELIREDLDLLRNSSWRGDARGGGHMLVIDRRYGAGDEAAMSCDRVA